jgi:hypothetical protein
MINTKTTWDVMGIIRQPAFSYEGTGLVPWAVHMTKVTVSVRFSTGAFAASSINFRSN